MKNHSIIFVGLDTHKEFTEVVYCADERSAEMIHIGRISSAKTSFVKLARQLQSKHPHSILFTKRALRLLDLPTTHEPWALLLCRDMLGVKVRLLPSISSRVWPELLL